MIKSIFKRLAEALLTIWGLASLLFILFQIIPGDPARMMLSQREDEELLKVIRAKYGFDKPVLQQYFYYLNDLSPISIASSKTEDFTYPGDKFSFITLLKIKDTRLILKMPYLRESYQRNGQSVSKIIAQVLPNTIILAVVSMGFAMLMGIFLGILAALYKNSWFDRMLSLFGSVGMSIPSFFAAIIVAWIFGYLLHDITGLQMTGNLFSVDPLGRGQILNWYAIILPAFTLGVRPLAIVIQLTRGSMLDVLSQDYIRTAKSKGLSTYKIIKNHALKNALNPVLTAASGWFAGTLAGSVFVESIFAWNGIGKTIVDAMNNLDLPVVMGAVLVISSIFIIINMLVDIAYRRLDPRISK